MNLKESFRYMNFLNTMIKKEESNMDNEFNITTNEVEFDEDLYQTNLKENDFTSWEDAEGVGSDDVKGEE